MYSDIVINPALKAALREIKRLRKELAGATAAYRRKEFILKMPITKVLKKSADKIV